MVKIRLEQKDVSPQAREERWGWEHTRVSVMCSDGSIRPNLPVGGQGLLQLAAPSGDAPSCRTIRVSREKPHHERVVWQIVARNPEQATPGRDQTLTLATRLRLSISGNGALFMGKGNEADPAYMKLIKEAGIDDVCLVHTITFVDEKSVDWAKGFQPGGRPDHRDRYLRSLIKQLHPGVQVRIGYEMVAKAKEQSALGKKFADWVLKAKKDEIDEHAKAIFRFFEAKDLEIDGVGFNLEINELKEEHRDGLGKLFAATAKEAAKRGRFVTYDTSPFTRDGKDGSVKSQPYRLCANVPNLVARPMCYGPAKDKNGKIIEGKVAPIGDERLAATVTCALSRDKETGGGLHPAQLQLALYAPQDLEKLKRDCQKVCRPNLAGVVLYPVPVGTEKEKAEAIKAFLGKCKELNQTLNPSLPAAVGQPLQVPR